MAAAALLATVPAAQQTLAILRYLGRQAGPVPAASVVRDLQLPRSTVYHLLSTLADEGFVTRLPEDRRYYEPVERGYEVIGATRLAQGAARLLALGPSSLTIRASRPGTTFVRVRFTPYWTLTNGSGCVAPDGGFTRVTLRRPGLARLGISFSLGRIRAVSPRCN